MGPADRSPVLGIDRTRDWRALEQVYGAQQPLAVPGVYTNSPDQRPRRSTRCTALNMRFAVPVGPDCDIRPSRSAVHAAQVQ